MAGLSMMTLRAPVAKMRILGYGPVFTMTIRNVSLLLAAILAVTVSAWAFAPARTLVLSLGMGWTLLALAVIDWRSFILPDPLNLLLAGLGALMVWLIQPDAWLDHAVGGTVGYLLLLGVELAYRGARGRDGLGRGDAKLVGALGLWVGWARLPDILLIGSALGLAAVLVSSRLSGRDMSSTTSLAFGPWLALAGWISWLAGPILVPDLAYPILQLP